MTSLEDSGSKAAAKIWLHSAPTHTALHVRAKKLDESCNSSAGLR